MFFKNAWRIGFHTSVGGNPTGIGDYVRRCNDAGVPAHIKAADGTAGLSDALALPTWNAPHTLIYRTSVWKVGLPSINNPDVPNYNNDPKAEALAHFNWHELSWPQELKDKRDRVWFEFVNEIDKTKAEWIAEFLLNCHDIGVSRGYKLAFPGWSSGEPEPENWEGPNMLDLIRLVGDRPEDRAFALHEYSFTANGIFTMKLNNQYYVITRDDPNFGWLVGRFHVLHDVCDNNKIKRPRIFITEFGWAETNAPSVAIAMTHLAQAQQLYNEHPNITMAAIWWLGPKYGDICNLIQPLIGPVTTSAMLTSFEPADYFPDPEPELTWQQQVWRESEAFQEAFGIHLNPDAAYQKQMIIDGKMPHGVLVPVHREKDIITSDGIQRRYQAAEDMWGELPRTIYTGYLTGKITSFTNPFETTQPGNPLDGLVIGPPFADYFIKTSSFNDPRDYDGDGVYDDLHEGVDYDIPNEPSDSKKPVLCGYPGTVIWAGTKNTAYGYYTIVQCENNGAPFELWYCHKDSVYTQVGQHVERGTPLGELGDTGGPWAEHVHMNLVVPGYGATTGYVVKNVVDPDPYVQKIAQQPPANGRILTGLHMTADGRPYTPADRENLKALKPDTITVLSMHNDSDIAWAANTFPYADFVVRMFLSFGGRNITPQQFVNDTLSDTIRTLNALGGRSRVIQIHNEPNLTSEGLGASWPNGVSFNLWYQDVLARLRTALPNERFIFPGLSPGGTVAGIREDSNQFLQSCRQAIALSDGLGAHTYWATQRGWPMSRAVAEIDAMIASFPIMPIWITECSNNRIGITAQQKAVEYAQFGSLMGDRGNVMGLTFFVASAGNPLYGWSTSNQDNHGETWDVNMMGGLVRAEIDKLP